MARSTSLRCSKVKAHGFDDSLTIEREISGEQQAIDIHETHAYLNRLIAELK